jgi:hypothetical protein
MLVRHVYTPRISNAIVEVCLPADIKCRRLLSLSLHRQSSALEAYFDHRILSLQPIVQVPPQYPCSTNHHVHFEDSISNLTRCGPPRFHVSLESHYISFGLQPITHSSALLQPWLTKSRPHASCSTLTEGNLRTLQSQLDNSMKDGGMLSVEQKALRKIQDAALELGLKLSAKTLKKDRSDLDEWVEEQSRE